MGKKRKRRTGGPHKTTSTAKNVALLFLSLGMVVCSCIVYAYLFGRHGITLDPLQKAISGLSSEERPDKPSPETGPTPPRQQAASAYDFMFYDMLGNKDEAHRETGSYSVQVAAFKSEESAKTMARSLEDKTRVKFRIDRKGPSYFVRWGSFSTKEKADRQCARLSEKLGRECIVVRM